MGSIPRDFIQSVLSRTEITDLIDDRLPLQKKSGSNFFACCPFHQEKSASFSVSQTKQFYYCFGCGAHGNAIDFLMQFDRLTFPEAIETLAKNLGLEIPVSSHVGNNKPTASPSALDLLKEVTTYFQTQLRQHPEAIEYLKKRGISGEIAKQFQLGFAPPGWNNLFTQFGKSPATQKLLHETGMLIKKEDGSSYDRFRERLIFPIQDKRGRVIGFGGRVLDHGEPKYLNSPETPFFQKSHELYGLFNTMQNHREIKRILIVEGYMDVIALFQHGIDYAVATLGTATSTHHLYRLYKHTSDIIFCFDGDEAGRKAAWRALEVSLETLQDGIQIRFMFLPEKEDPDSVLRKEGKHFFTKCLDDALSLSQFFFQSLAHKTDLSSLEGRARFSKLASAYLDKMPDSVFKKMMFAELTKKSGVQTDSNSNPPKFIPKVPKQKPISLLRLALTLLIHQPSLALGLKENLPHLNAAGFDLLQEVFIFAKTHPEVNTAGLLENWRDKAAFAILAKLAQAELMIPMAGYQKEFSDTVKKLQKQANDQMIDELLNKANAGILTTDERKLLQSAIGKNK